MKLYLSSYRLGNHGPELARMVGGARRVGIVRNALDFSTDMGRLERGRVQEFSDLHALGLLPEILDVREYFDASARLQAAIDNLDALWVVGGNAFILRRAIHQSGLDRVLAKKAANSAFVYAGYSAGSCVTGVTLRGLQFADDPVTVPPGYSPDPIWAGLGFVPFALAPHYRSPHPESGLVEDVIDAYIKEKTPFIVLRDGEVHISEFPQQC
jgi:dipeptidase E